MSHSGSGYGGHSSSGYSHGDGGQSIFHYSVGDNYNPIGTGTYFEDYRLEHLTEGLRINNGIRFAVLFIAFFGWLYVVYWLRHHEPLAQHSIGTNAIVTATSNQDKSIVASIRKAFPFKTSPDFGAAKIQNLRFNSIRANAGEAISAPINSVDPDFNESFGQPINSATSGTNN